MVRNNSKFIIEDFLEKYVNNINAHDISRDDESHDENIHAAGTHNSDAEGNSMRGLELVQKILDRITLEDWHKVERTMGYKHIYHYKKSDMIDLDINGQIADAIKSINENNFN